MTIWRVTEAKARLSEVLDKTETEEPQVIRRRKTEFHLLTKEQLEERCKERIEEKPFVSGWDALQPSFEERYDDVEFPRLPGKMRTVDLE
jgi:prevent-host-death family protein